MNAVSRLPDMHPDEVEALLPWYAAGTLSVREARRVDEALARDANLARQYAIIQEEFAETIHLNESLGAPSSRAMQRLFAEIDAEPARAAPASSLGARIAAFFASLSPRTLAYSATAAALALLLQAGIIGTILMRQPQENFQTAAYEGQRGGGVLMLVRFAPEARLTEITQFLDSYNGAIVSGLKAGMFRIQFGETPLSADEAAGLIKKIEAEKIVSFVAPAS